MQRSFTLALLSLALLAGCSDPAAPDAGRPQTADKWYRRAQSSFTAGDFDDAHESVQKALGIAPEDVEVKTLAGQVALASLDYAETLRLLKGVHTSEAASLRGRAYWYKGELDAAADELEAMLNDPDVKDDWAKSAAKLARRGAGRTPFSISGAILASVEMVHVSPVAPYFVVPIEIDGKKTLAMIHTGNAEVVLDSATRSEPSWVQIRFQSAPQPNAPVPAQSEPSTLQIDNVPALVQDLSGISKDLGSTEIVKALIGVNLLRRLNVTLDYEGRQFVVRTFTPPPPPRPTRVGLHYVRGGGLVMQGTFGGEKGPVASLFVDTSKPYPIALDQEGWKKAGLSIDALKPVQGDPEQKLKEGVVPLLRLGSVSAPRVTGLYGAPFTDLEKMTGVNLDGVIGAGLLYGYRCTFGDDGRVLWIEDDNLYGQGPENGPPPGPPPGAGQPKNEGEAPPAPKPTAPPGVGSIGPGGGEAPLPAPALPAKRDGAPPSNAPPKQAP